MSLEPDAFLESLGATVLWPQGAWLLDVADFRAPARDYDVSSAFDRLAERPGIAVVRIAPELARYEALLAASLVAAAPDVVFAGPARPPLWASTPHRLAERVGFGRALDLWLTGSIDARTAREIGLVDGVSSSPRELADSWAATWSSSRYAVTALHLLVQHGRSLPPAAARRLERALFALAFCGDDAKEGAQRFFR